jgi:hypothetical protein
MKRNPEIGQELLGLSPAVANLSARMPFHVPEGYFELFPERMLDLLKAEHELYPETVNTSVFDVKTGVSGPFMVPNGYFEGLSGNILAKIRENEEETVKSELGRISPLLDGSERINPFTVPAGYFENLDIQSSIIPAQNQPALVISMGGRKKWLNYAAAAVITAFLAGAIYLYSSISGNNLPSGIQSLANVEKTEKDSIQVSPEALSSFLDQTDGLVESEVFEMDIDSIGQSLAILEINETEIRTLLQGLPDEAISGYIAENPDTGDSTN